jgi:L-threonylcarbamoyladenylate synthase
MPGISSISPSNLDQAVKLLQAGGVLVYPTETSYALGCDATNDAAVARVFAIKGRPEGKGTPIILPPDADPALYVEWNNTARALAAQHWPGPLNMVADRAARSSVSVRCETDGTQSVRRSSHPVAAELARLLGRPLVATSANRSGESAIYRADEVEREFAGGQQPDGILEAGDLPVVPASTTVKVVGGTVELVRQGSIIV